MTKTRAGLGLVGWLAVSFSAAAVGGIFTAPGYYQALARPPWAPPAWLFGPVWTVLYFLIGIAAWLVWRKGGFGAAGGALTIFLVQHVLNGLWSWLFFGLREPGIAFAEILLLWALILATTAAFALHSRVASLLMAPYFLWVTYAAALNFALWQMNTI